MPLQPPSVPSPCGKYMSFSRRQFLKIAALSAAGLPLLRRAAAQTGEWVEEAPAAAEMRRYLESVVGERSMALEFRRFNRRHDEQFRVQVNGDKQMPVASCFKAFVALYYFLTLPEAEWQAGENSPVYRMAVFSNNVETGTVLQMTAARVRGDGNAIEKFNNFLRRTVGIWSGIYGWNWPGNPIADQFDPRHAPDTRIPLDIRGRPYTVDNAFTVGDLARGWDVIWRGEFFAVDARLRAALRATKALFAIPAGDYRSPIERVYADGYTGKDGILPAESFAAGRVIDDAGIIEIGDAAYLVAFMSAGESESTAIDVLREVIAQIEVAEAAFR